MITALPVPVEAILFDLDGTLADTAPDLAAAVNRQRQARGDSPLPVEMLRPHVSQGARGMLRVGFGVSPQDPSYPALRDEFLALYENNLCDESRLFPGMSELLKQLEQRQIAWGIVTNKLERYTLPLVEALGLASGAACIISGDTAARAKPHPDPLLEASRRLALRPSVCCYVGDDERDVQASLAAGMTPIVALYGYLGDGNHPEDWGAALFIRTPLELLNLLPATPPMP